MIFSILMYIQLNTMLLFMAPIATFSNAQLLKRDIRFTKFDIHSLNHSLLFINKSRINQYYNKQVIYVHYVIQEDLGDAVAKLDVSKCKDHYVDCVNVVSYEIKGFCSKKFDSIFFIQGSSAKNNLNSVCKLGESQNNITFAADQFGTFFSYPTEKWWELYWKVRTKLFTKDKVLFGSSNIQFYFIQYRSRNRTTKN